MALTAAGGMPIVNVGGALREGVPIYSSVTNTTIAATRAACIMYGYIWTSDGSSHTIDTSGSSSLEWRTGGVTFSNAGTTVVVGLAAVDLTVGPPGRAANASGVITFDVSKTLTGGGGGITGSAWQSHVPDTGSKTIAHGDLVAFAVQMTARGGTDSVTVATTGQVADLLPSITALDGSSNYTAATRAPNVVITFSDGAYGFFYGCTIVNALTTTSFNSSSTTREYGNVYNLPFPAGVYGVRYSLNVTSSGSYDVILYSSPFSAPPTVITSVSIDPQVIASAGSNNLFTVMFTSFRSLSANTDYAVALRPTSTTNITITYKSVNSTTHMLAEYFGNNSYGVNRGSTANAFSVSNSYKDLMPISLLLGSFDNGSTASGGGGETGGHILGGAM